MPFYHLSSSCSSPLTIEAEDARQAIQVATKTVERLIQVTCEGPELTTVWCACKYGQRVVRWRWNQETKSP